MSILICDHVASELWPKMSLSLSSRSGLHSVWNRLKDICWNVAELKVCYPISDSSPVKSEDREGGLMAARVTFSHSYQSPTRKCQPVNIFETLFLHIFLWNFAARVKFSHSYQTKTGKCQPVHFIRVKTWGDWQTNGQWLQISGVECEKCGAGRLVKRSPGSGRCGTAPQ